MGCSASKGSTRKRTAKDSWYTPVSRSASAPIHYVAEVEQDDYHFEDTPSTLYSFIKREAANERGSRGTLSLMLQEEEHAFVKSNHSTKYSKNEHATERDITVYKCESRKRLASSKTYSKYNSKLNSVKEGFENDAYDVETIDTWELMKGLDEDDGRSPIKTSPKRSVFEKSQSFNKVHGLDSCFAEMGSPVWHRYFVEQDAESTHEHEKLEFERPSSNEEEDKLGVNRHGSTLMSPAKSPLKSPLKSPARSPWRTPMRSPLKSPARSPLMSPNSPLFDPSLLAKFEQAIHASTLPCDEWPFTHSINEGSTTTSSSSCNNHTWGSTETSSDGESAQYVLKESPLMKNVITASPRIKDVNVPYNLESFEPRCPPKGKDKVVLYFTSLRGVRKTYEDCCVLRLILQGLGVYVDERDVWMHSKFREELNELLDNKRLQVPRLFIKGRYIGGMEDVRQLHEDGFLIRLIEGLPCFGLFRKPCEGCADVRFVPCFTCRGSCKVLDEEDHVIRCSECNENGLIMCPLCS